MGTTADKGEYLNTTKSLLKDKINNLGGEITDETTFREYTNQLQEVYDRLPKTEYQEGSNITLENTLKGKLDFEDDIVTRGQTSQDTTNGYQLINNPSFADVTSNSVTFHRNSDGSYTLTGTSTGLAVVKISQALELENGVAYYVSGGISENIAIDIRDNNNASYGTRSTSPTTTGSYTPSSSMSNMYVCVRVASGTTTNVTIYPMISKTNTYNWEKYTGGQASPNPSYPQTINSVTGNQDVVVRGKNVCNISTFSNNYSLDANGNPVVVQNNRIANTIPIDVSKYNNVTISFATSVSSPKLIYGLLNNDTTIERVANQNSGITINTQNANKLYISLYNKDNDINLESVTFLQVETGSTATTYEPYITPITYQLSLGDIELNAIGNYKDELVTDRSTGKWYKYAKIGKKVYTGAGSETWSFVNFSETKKRSYIDVSDIITSIPNSDNVPILCNNFINDSYTNGTSGTGHLNVITGRYEIAQINIFHNVADSNSNFKTWLSTHNTIVYYALATPTLTEITDENMISQLEDIYKMQSLNGTTIVETAGDLPPIVKIRGLKGE